MLTFLNVGCGTHYNTSSKDIKWVNIDISNDVKCDLVCEVGKEKLPLDDESVEFIECIDVIEHLDDLIPFMNECHRVLKKGCQMIIRTPQPTTKYFWQDPTHKHGYVANTFLYYFLKQPWNIPTYKIKYWSNVESSVEKGIENNVEIEILNVKMTK